MSLGERLKEIRNGLPQADFAKQVGVTTNTVGRLERGENVPDAEYLKKILEIYPDIDPAWLLTGKGETKRGTVSIVAETRVTYAGPEDIEKEYVLVPRYNVKVSAGGGSLVDNAQVIDHLAFKTVWIRTTMHLNPADLLLVNTMGDSMYPTIKEGDMLLVDKSQREVRDDAIYILLNDGALIAKRLQKLYDGSIQIKSDNKVYDTQLVPFDRVNVLNIIGRVVWGGGRM